MNDKGGSRNVEGKEMVEFRGRLHWNGDCERSEEKEWEG